MASDREIQRVAGVDTTEFPLTPPERYMLSLIDSTASIPYLSLATGLPETAVVTILERLVTMGVVTWADGACDPSNAHETHDTLAHESTARDTLRAPSAKDDRQPDDKLDIDAKKRREIDEMYRSLSYRNMYELLCIEPDATTADVRKAYFELSKTYHPDTLFRKNLGPYKGKMEAIFAKLTQAYELLSNPKTREPYDQSIRARTVMPPAPSAPPAPSSTSSKPSSQPARTSIVAPPRSTIPSPAERSRASQGPNTPSGPPQTHPPQTHPPQTSPPQTVAPQSAQAAVAGVQLDPAKADALRRRAAARIHKAIRSIQKK